MLVQRQTFLAVTTRAGKTVNIARGMLPDPAAFDTLHRTLIQRLEMMQ